MITPLTSAAAGTACLLSGAGILFATLVGAPADQLDADEIARRIHTRDEGRMVSRTVVMELISRQGQRRERVTRSFWNHYGQEKRIVIFFQSPSNVKGTALLTYDYPETGRADDQWLYLPALRQVRRISSADRGSYFLGSDFTYEDIKTETKLGIDDYTRTRLREEMVDGQVCYVVEALPVNDKTAKELGYSRVLQWVDPNIWMPRKGEYWDIRGNPLKTIHIRDIREVQGIWTGHSIEAVNHQTRHRTVLTMSDVDYKRRVDDDLFTERGLRRGL